MQVYASLAVHQQSEIMEGLYLKSPGQQLNVLVVNSEGHSAELLSVLNRMTADVSDLSMVRTVVELRFLSVCLSGLNTVSSLKNWTTLCLIV
jgi:hypothetical protein